MVSWINVYFVLNSPILSVSSAFYFVLECSHTHQFFFLVVFNSEITEVHASMQVSVVSLKC